MLVDLAFQETSQLDGTSHLLSGTQCQLVHINRYDSDTGHIGWVTWAGLGSKGAQSALAAVRKIFPTFDPTRLVLKADVNRWNKIIYLDGQTVSAPFVEVSKGVVDDRIINIASKVLRLRHSYVVPITIQGRIVGSLAYHSSRQFTSAQTKSCQAFTHQAALALENALLLEQLSSERDVLKQAVEVLGKASAETNSQTAYLLRSIIQSSLLAVSQRLSETESSITLDPTRTTAMLQEVREIIGKLQTGEISLAAERLYPALLRVSLGSAVKSFVNKLGNNPGITLTLSPKFSEMDGPNLQVIPEASAFTAYRIIELAVSGITAQRSPTSLEILLDITNDSVIALDIQEKEGSFDIDEMKKSQDFKVINALVTQSKGSWNVSRVNGIGISIHVSIP